VVEKLNWQITNNMFGYTSHLIVGDVVVPVAENLELDWQRNQKSFRKGYWFRAPKISVSELATTLSFLSELENPFNLEVFGDDVEKLSASLRLKDETDAATVAWTLTTTWMKWSPDAERELKTQKPTKLRVGKSGQIKATITVTSIEP
jgi:hypothetical protein